jgi:hypothetical protein
MPKRERLTGTGKDDVINNVSNQYLFNKFFQSPSNCLSSKVVASIWNNQV